MPPRSSQNKRRRKEIMYATDDPVIYDVLLEGDTSSQFMVLSYQGSKMYMLTLLHCLEPFSNSLKPLPSHPSRRNLPGFYAIRAKKQAIF